MTPAVQIIVAVGKVVDMGQAKTNIFPQGDGINALKAADFFKDVELAVLLDIVLKLSNHPVKVSFGDFAFDANFDDIVVGIIAILNHGKPPDMVSLAWVIRSTQSWLFSTVSTIFW